jgi:hypothetical protein
MTNVGKVYQVMGGSRQQFYEIHHNYQAYGTQDLIGRAPRNKTARNKS